MLEHAGQEIYISVMQEQVASRLKDHAPGNSNRAAAIIKEFTCVIKQDTKYYIPMEIEIPKK